MPADPPGPSDPDARDKAGPPPEKTSTTGPWPLNYAGPSTGRPTLEYVRESSTTPDGAQWLRVQTYGGTTWVRGPGLEYRVQRDRPARDSRSAVVVFVVWTAAFIAAVILAGTGLPLDRTPLMQAVVMVVILLGTVIVVALALKKRGFSVLRSDGTALIIAQPKRAFPAAYDLTSGDGIFVGTLSKDPRGHDQWTLRDADGAARLTAWNSGVVNARARLITLWADRDAVAAIMCQLPPAIAGTSDMLLFDCDPADRPFVIAACAPAWPL